MQQVEMDSQAARAKDSPTATEDNTRQGAIGSSSTLPGNFEHLKPKFSLKCVMKAKPNLTRDEDYEAFQKRMAAEHEANTTLAPAPMRNVDGFNNSLLNADQKARVSAELDRSQHIVKQGRGQLRAGHENRVKNESPSSDSEESVYHSAHGSPATSDNGEAVNASPLGDHFLTSNLEQINVQLDGMKVHNAQPSTSTISKTDPSSQSPSSQSPSSSATNNHVTNAFSSILYKRPATILPNDTNAKGSKFDTKNMLSAASAAQPKLSTESSPMGPLAHQLHELNHQLTGMIQMEAAAAAAAEIRKQENAEIFALEQQITKVQEQLNGTENMFFKFGYKKRMEQLKDELKCKKEAILKKAAG